VGLPCAAWAARRRTERNHSTRLGYYARLSTLSHPLVDMLTTTLSASRYSALLRRFVTDRRGSQSKP
jgi:hypothetical protein